jgi:DNA adenine methylase
VFRVLQDVALAGRLRALVAFTPFARAEFKRAYEPPVADPVEMARRTIIKSFMGFGSSAIHGRSRGMRTRASVWRGPATGFRSNSNRSGTTPAHDWANWPDAIPQFVERLTGVVIEETEALKLLATHDRADALHYVDPPYVRATRSKQRKRKSEYLYELDDDEHRLLATCLHGLKGYVVLSGYQSDLYAELYADWERHDRAALADGAKKRIESLWLSPRTSAARREVRLAL